jgi:hypothetical protein
MDQNTPDHLFGDLQVDHESGAHFKEGAKWANFIAIIYFICIALLLLVFLFAGATLFSSGVFSGQLETSRGMVDVGEVAPVAAAFGFVVLLAFLGLFIVGGINLYRFGSRCREAIDRQDQLTFNMGLKSLRNYFICTGILAIVGTINQIISFIGI